MRRFAPPRTAPETPPSAGAGTSGPPTTMAEGGSETLSLSPLPPPRGRGRKAVRFDDAPPLVEDTISRSDLTEEEAAATWYGDKEFEEIEAEADRVAKSAALRERGRRRGMRGSRKLPGGETSGDGEGKSESREQEEEEVCSRGLEHRKSPRASYLRETARQRCLNAVLDKDWTRFPEEVAKASMESSRPERERAERTGKADEKERARIWKEENRVTGLVPAAVAPAPVPLALASTGANTLPGGTGNKDTDQDRAGFYANFSSKLSRWDPYMGSVSASFRSKMRGEQMGGALSDAPPEAPTTPTATPETTERKRQPVKRTRFAKSGPTTHTIVGVWEMSPEDQSLKWYSRSEIEHMESETEFLVKTMNRRKLLGHERQDLFHRSESSDLGAASAKEEEEEDSLRGLEHISSARTCYVRDKNRRRVVEAVLDAQERLRKGGNDGTRADEGSANEWDAIFEASQRFSKSAQERAEKMGKADERESRSMRRFWC